MKGVFVTGSNTGVGKTTVAIEIVRHMSQTRDVKVRKPVETNCELSGQNYMPKEYLMAKNLHLILLQKVKSMREMS